MTAPLRLAALFTAAGATLYAATFATRFTGTEFEQTWSVQDLALPADWPADDFLVLEFRASSPQRFQLRVHTSAGLRSVLMHPYAGARVRAAIPLQAWWQRPHEGVDMAAVGNKSRAGYFLGLWGPFGPLTGVQSVGVRMEHPIGEPTLEITSIRLAKDSPGDAVLTEGSAPLVDEMGQWAGADWPGKAKSIDELKKDWAREQQSLAAGDFGYCRYGGFEHTHANATGYFRVEQMDGKWWFVDPDGHLFFSTGVDVITPWMATPTENRGGVFAALPAELRPPDREDRKVSGASFFTWNLWRRFGADWHAGWIDLTARRMDAWGLNTVGNWSDARVWDAHRKAYTMQLEGWYTKATYLGMPDVYGTEFARNCDKAARRQCAPRRRDPWLLGYFIGNEPPWPNHESMLVDMILAGPDTATHRELTRWLAAGDTPERRTGFVYRAFDKYLAMTKAAVRKYDPNHLNLGIRFGGHPPDAVARAGRVFDVYSINIYSIAADNLAHQYELSGRPLLIGEFHFGTPGRGLAASLVQVRDQNERGVAYRYYVENAAAMPALIGTHWFQWMDEPASGRSDGENYNIGLVDVTDRPYAELVAALAATHRRMEAVHAGREAPFAQKPVPQ